MWITGSALCVAVLVFIPALVFSFEMFAGLFVTKNAIAFASSGRRTIAVLIPAHDESVGLLDTLRTALPQLTALDRCLVVADNCTDDTAEVARRAGADVIERFDSTLRGKGYALDFGLRHLSVDAPDVVVMIDADCRIEAGGIALLAERSIASGRPVQGLYLMRAPRDASSTMRIAEFAWRIKNRVRPRGLLRMGLPCQLMGSGMAFPWSALRDVELATGHIVEDMKLGLDLASRGRAPLFCEDALVTGHFPTQAAGVREQRTRWEHGHLGLIVGELPRLFARAIMRGDGMLFALALDLAVPPLAMLVIAMLVSLTLSLFAFGVAGWGTGLAISVTGLALVFVAVLVGWWTNGRDILPLHTLLLAPWYAFCKVPLYARFLVKRQAEWVRSKRDPS